MTSTLLNIGARSLAAAQGQLATTSHNVANANTEGYSRQEAVLTTSQPQFIGGAFFGRGVDLTTVRRQYDQFLVQAARTTATQASADQARTDSLSALDGLFSDPEQGIGATLDNLFAAIGDMANRPADSAARQALLSRLDQAATRFNTLGGQLAQLGDQADARLAYEASQVNDHLTEVRQLNGQIAAHASSGQPPNDLLDQRDKALQALGGFLQVSAVPNRDGTISLFTASGAPLLVGSQQAQLSAVPDASDASRLSLRLQVGGLSQPLDQAALGGGSLAGTLHFRDADLAAAANRLGQMATALAGALNGQQALGVDASGAPGQPLFTLPAPTSRPHADNAGSGALAASVFDASALQASDYRVSWNGTDYSVTRLSDQQVTTGLVLPATLDGLSFTPSGAPVAGDSWLVQPFDQAATGLRARALAPSQLATGYAAMAQAAGTNTGSGRVAAFEMSRAGADNTLSVAITFNSPPTSYNVTGLAGGNLANVPFTPGAQVPAAPADWNGWRITLEGAPAAGDRFDVQRSTQPGADNRNALALGRIADRALVGGGTLNAGYAGLLADVGGRVQTARNLAEVSAHMQAQAQARKEDVAGVNLDEEAANLLRFQQAYQASAKIIQASQVLFESLLSATGR